MQYVTGPLFRFVELAGWINELTMYASVLSQATVIPHMVNLM
jgi:hypothetical protein